VQDGSGLTSQAVQSAIQKAGRPDFPMRNVSPKLSFFKSKGWLDLNEGVWRITMEGAKELVESKN
jgi:hypothetical protein